MIGKPIRLYRPSNGTEGGGFIDYWCSQCERDINEDCDILARSFAHDIDEPEYPREWIYDTDGPRCTAFIERGKPLPPPKDDKTLDMFA